jgi:hypothetical protein
MGAPLLKFVTKLSNFIAALKEYSADYTDRKKQGADGKEAGGRRQRLDEVSIDIQRSVKDPENVDIAVRLY